MSNIASVLCRAGSHFSGYLTTLLRSRKKMFRSRIDGLQICVGSVGLVVCAVIFSGLAYIFTENNRIILRGVEGENKYLARVVGQYTSAALQLIDHTLKQGRSEWLAHAHIKDHRLFYEDFPSFKSLIHQIAVIDSSGYLAGSSIEMGVQPIYLGDKDYFKAHVGSSGDELFVSTPLVDLVSRHSSIQFSRPIRDNDGGFGGVIIASVDPNFVGNVAHEVEGEGRVSLGLIGADGIARSWIGPLNFGASDVSFISTADFSANAQQLGNFSRQKSAPSNISWLVEKLNGYPLQLVIGRDATAVIQQIKVQKVLAVGLAGALLAFIAASAIYSLRLIRLRESASLKMHESQIRANSANEMKSRFVADMSHELRTPLNGILGFSELISRSTDVEKTRNYGHLINTCAKHLHLLVNTMLDLSKIEAGKMDVVRTICDLREVCESVVGIHRYAAEAKGLVVSVEYGDGVPESIYTDRIKLMQILNNVLHNAIKFTRNGYVFFHVGRFGDDWVFGISDTGIGMTPGEVGRLFTRFGKSSARAQMVAQQTGSGLGMALCKELTKLLNGKIAVSSSVGVGTLIEIRFQSPHEKQVET